MQIMVKIKKDVDETDLGDFEAVILSDGRVIIPDYDGIAGVMVIEDDSIRIFSRTPVFRTFADIKNFFNVDVVQGVKKIRITIEEI